MVHSSAACWLRVLFTDVAPAQEMAMEFMRPDSSGLGRNYRGQHGGVEANWTRMGSPHNLRMRLGSLSHDSLLGFSVCDPDHTWLTGDCLEPEEWLGKGRANQRFTLTSCLSVSLSQEPVSQISSLPSSAPTFELSVSHSNRLR